MRIVSFDQANTDFKAVLDGVIDDADVTVINCGDGKDAVLMPLVYFQQVKESMHLLSSLSNVKHLAESIKQYRQGKSKKIKID